ncbi:MAG: plastocyanin/azurin family copper-binding protein [Pseudomonadota bacterium]
MAKIVLSNIFAVFLLLWPITSAAQDAQVVVDQFTDLSAPTAAKMYRFTPNIVRIKPGATVEFLNSRGSHTVHSQSGLWPLDVPPVAIAGQSSALVTFDAPGIYGLTCHRHGRYGMVMLVLVGDVDHTQVDVSTLPASDLAKSAYEGLLSEITAQ